MERIVNKGTSEVINQIKHPHSIIIEYQLLMHHHLSKEVKAECFYPHTLSSNCFEELNNQSAASTKQSALTKQSTLMKQSALMKQYFDKAICFRRGLLWVSNQASYTLLPLWQQGCCYFLFLSALLRIIYGYRGSGVIPVAWLGVLG